jgi:drug/metabolite transporter (DMT)-like permease
LEEAVLTRHREIFYGLLFGVGAALLDILIDAIAQDKPYWDVPTFMILYRFLFILFGLLLGWLLWRKNTSEREFRSLQDQVQELRQKIGAPTILIRTQAQLLLGRDASQLSPEVQSMVRIIYEQSQKLQSIERERVA